MKHELKILSEYFEAVASGEKKFEVRYDDRDYQVGDELILCEIDNDGNYTGQCIRVNVTYVYRGEYCKRGYCIMSIALREQKKTVDISALAGVVENIRRENRSIERDMRSNEKLSAVLIGKNEVLDDYRSILACIERELTKLCGGGTDNENSH